MILSIIIPVYKVEDTLRECVESIISQSFNDWEMILVDDGSPDCSGTIADQLANSDTRIKVFHKTNGGLSDARNYGIRQSGGEYITFVDSDDMLAPDTLLPLMTIIKEHPECDILEYPVLVHANSSDEHMLSLPNRLWTSAHEYWIHTEGWEHSYAWNKIYRRSIFDKIGFPVGRVFEDMWIWPKILSLNPTVMTTSNGLYKYIWNAKGITVNASVDDLKQLLYAQMRAAVLMHTTPFTNKGRKLYRSMACRLYDIIRFSF